MAGKGGKGKGKTTWRGKSTCTGKGKGPRAVGMADSFANVLPSTDGDVLVHKWGYRSDRALLSSEAIAACVGPENCEAMNRPAKWVSMLSGSMASLARIVRSKSGTVKPKTPSSGTKRRADNA